MTRTQAEGTGAQGGAWGYYHLPGFQTGQGWVYLYNSEPRAGGVGGEAGETRDGVPDK